MFGEAVGIVGLPPSEYWALTLEERDAIFTAYRKHQEQLAKQRRL